MKAQLSVEFLILFSVIVIVFVFLFATVANERGVQLEGQTFSNMQLVAQSISTQINNAVDSGSGYSVHVPVYGYIGSIRYNITVSRQGIVAVSAKIGSQKIQTIAYSSARNIQSNSIFLTANGIYSLPTVNGSIYIANYNGNVCVDYSCQPSPLNSAPAQVSLSTTSQPAAYFNGQAGFINTTKSNIQITYNSITITAWVNIGPGGGGTIASNYNAISNIGYSLYIEKYPPYEVFLKLCNGTVGGSPSGGCSTSSGWGGDTSTPQPYISTDKWVFIAAEDAGPDNLQATITEYDYGGIAINSNVGEYYSSPGYYSGVGTVYFPSLFRNSGTPTTIGMGEGTGGEFNGSITDVQIYNTTLTGPQIQQMYAEGINAQPSPGESSYLKGWWPLEYNANDSSGNANNGIIKGLVAFNTVYQISTTVKNFFGSLVPNALVGYQTNFRNYSTGSKSLSFFTNITNSSGYGNTAFGGELLPPGLLQVTATAMSSNSLALSLAQYTNQLLSTSLKGWWPMNLGQGSSAYDLSGYNNTGIMYNVSWAAPSYATQFSEASSDITVADSNTLNTAWNGHSWTISAWIDEHSPITSGTSRALVQETNGCTSGLWYTYSSYPAEYLPLTVEWTTASVNCGGGASDLVVDGPPAPYNTWVFFTAAFNYSNQEIFACTNGVCNTNYGAGLGADYATASPGLVLQDSADCCSGTEFNGSMADVQLYNTALSENQIYSLYQEGIGAAPISANAVGWWPLDGDANDYSNNGNNGVIEGPVSYVGLPKQSNNATDVLVGSFNGVSSRLNGTYSSALNPPKFSVSLWVDALGGQGVYRSPLSSRGYDSNGGTVVGYNFYASNGNAWEFWIGAGPSWSYLTGDPVQLGQWINLVGTYNGSVEDFYNNGQLVASTTATLYQNSNTLCAFTIGSLNPCDDNAYPFNGLISNVQVYNTSLSAKQVQSLYNEGIDGSPVQTSDIVGWWLLDGSGSDFAGSTNLVSSNVVYKSTSVLPPSAIESSLNGYGAYFSGTQTTSWAQSYIKTGNVPIISGNQLSIFAWVDPTGSIFTECGGGAYCPTLVTNPAEGYQLGMSGGPSSFNVRPCLPGGCIYSTKTIGLNTWSFIGFTYNGVDTSIYINGALDSVQAQTGSFTAASGPMILGAYLSAPNGCSLPCDQYIGYMADVQIYNRTLSSQQILQLYNNGVPPSASTSVGIG